MEIKNKQMLQKFLSLFILLTITVSSFAQDTQSNSASESTTAEQKMAQLQEEIALLKKQQELEKAKSELSNQRLQEILNSLPKNSSFKSLDGKTAFDDDKDSNPESIALSYEALKEITAQIGLVMQPNVSKYSGLVIYNEPDFLWLAKYRLFRTESRLALRNYDLVADSLSKLNKENGKSNSGQSGRFGVKSVDPLTTALNLPTIGASYARSVAELFSVFRTDTFITQSKDTVDNDSLGTAMAQELKKSHPNLKILYPQAFVPEYDLDTEGEDSLFARISRINAANTYLGELVTQLGKIPEQERNAPPLRETINLAEIVKKQIQPLTLAENFSGNSNARANAETNASKTNMSEFRQLIRAEKLDRFLRGGSSDSALGAGNKSQVGILKLRVLASGGSRRETRNFFLGNKISYSGSAVIEVLLFDSDGTLRAAEIFSFHTGFREMKSNGK